MIPKARKITINDIVYYWNVRGGKSRYMGEQDPNLRLTVLRGNSGRCLTADLYSKRYTGTDDEPAWLHRVALTPSDVKKLILYSLKHGWNPEAKGSAFDLNKVTKSIELSHYKLA